METATLPNSPNLPDLVGGVFEAKKRRIKNWPVKANRASECGHPCERYLVLSRTRWQEKVLHGPELEFIFEGGRLIEEMALKELQEAGFQIIEQQRAFEWAALQLTGHLDCKVLWEGRAYPLEIKGLNHQDFERLNCLRDFLESPKVWIRKYPAQLTMYLLNTGHEKGAFYIKDKLNYQPKVVWIDLDYDYAETICKKLECVNKHVSEGTLPAPLDEYDICKDCAFVHVCLPEIKGQEMEFLDNDDLLAKLQRRDELAPVKSEYEALDREIKKAFENKAKACIGDYLIVGKSVTRAGYTVEPCTYWQTKITRLGGASA